MNNPIKPGIYTTIFKDGSIILYNQWLDDRNKWYWNEDYRGGVIHWFKPEENYDRHKYYKLPETVLYDFMLADVINQAYSEFLPIEYSEKAIESFLQKQHVDKLEDILAIEMRGYDRYTTEAHDIGFHSIEENEVQPARCDKCVYTYPTCGHNDKDSDCKAYKRDPPDGGYYG